jgi:hypothetical protein
MPDLGGRGTLHHAFSPTAKSIPPFRCSRMDDLDACAREMKRLLEVNRRGSLFEGWPSANDDAVEA